MRAMSNEMKDKSVSELRPSRRPGVVVYTRSMSLRLTAEEVSLLDEVGVSLGTSNSEVLRFLLRAHGPGYLPPADGESTETPAL